METLSESNDQPASVQVPSKAVYPKKQSCLLKGFKFIWFSCSSCSFMIVLLQISILFVLLLGLTKTGLVYIPFLSDRFGPKVVISEKKYPPEASDEILKRINQELQIHPFDFTITLSPEDLNTLLQNLNTNSSILKDMRFEIDGNEIVIFLSFAQLSNLQVESRGTLSVAENKISFRLLQAKVGNLALPDPVLTPLSDAINSALNDQLGKMQNMKIKTLDIKDGKIIVTGSTEVTEEKPKK